MRYVNYDTSSDNCNNKNSNNNNDYVPAGPDVFFLVGEHAQNHYQKFLYTLSWKFIPVGNISSLSNWDSEDESLVISSTSDVSSHYQGHNVNLAQWVLSSKMWIPTLTLTKWLETTTVEDQAYLRCNTRTKKGHRNWNTPYLCWHVSIETSSLV